MSASASSQLDYKMQRNSSALESFNQSKEKKSVKTIQVAYSIKINEKKCNNLLVKIRTFYLYSVVNDVVNNVVYTNSFVHNYYPPIHNVLMGLIMYVQELIQLGQQGAELSATDCSTSMKQVVQTVRQIQVWQLIYRTYAQ